MKIIVKKIKSQIPASVQEIKASHEKAVNKQSDLTIPVNGNEE